MTSPELKIGQSVELVGGPFDGTIVKWGGGKDIEMRTASDYWQPPSKWVRYVYEFRMRGQEIVAELVGRRRP